MKTNLTNMLRGKEKKNTYAKLNRGRRQWFIYLKINCKRRIVGKANKGINCVKNIIGLKN